MIGPELDNMLWLEPPLWGLAPLIGADPTRDEAGRPLASFHRDATFIDAIVGVTWR